MLQVHKLQADHSEFKKTSTKLLYTLGSDYNQTGTGFPITQYVKGKVHKPPNWIRRS